MDCTFYNGTKPSYDKIYKIYHPVHGYVASVLCTVGIVTNLCNVLVLTRSEMFSTVNMLLTAIAVCDTTTMFSYLIYLSHYRLTFFTCPLSPFTKAWAFYTLFHANLSVALRACSLWLTVVMAALRSHILSRHQVLLLRSRYIANLQMGYKLIFATLIAVFLMALPVFLNHTVESELNYYPQYTNRSDCPSILYDVTYPYYAQEQGCLIMKIGFWTNGLLLKLIPCFLLVYYLTKLIHFIRQHMQISQSLFGERENACSLKPTTFILTAILLMTLICELPNALASLFSGIESFAYGLFVYRCLGDIFDLLSLINCITSFIMYCTMSRLFRETFIGTMSNFLSLFNARHVYRRWSVVFGSTADFELQQQSNFRLTENRGFRGRRSTDVGLENGFYQAERDYENY